MGLLKLSGGEPLPNPDIKKILDYLFKENIRFHINTNGTLVDEELVKKITEHTHSSIQFSLDGASEATDDAIRCKGHYKKIVYLLQQFNQYDFRRGAVKMVINQLNYCEITEFFELCMKYGFLPSYAFLVKSGRAVNNWDSLSLSNEQQYAARKAIWDLLDKNEKYFDRFQSPNILYYLKNMNISHVGECQLNLDKCTFNPLIHTNGDVQPCEGLFQEEFCIGNLLKQNPEQIFTHENKLVQELSCKAKKRKKMLNEVICKDCFLNHTCGKGCIAESYNNGDFFGLPNDCHFRKREFIDNSLALRRK